MTEHILIRRPDDWHLHVRDGELLGAIIAHTATRFGRAIIMPNLSPPVVTADDALDYRNRILRHCRDYEFNPLMTLYLTPQTTPQIIRDAAKSEHVVAVKWYPAGATTHSEYGVSHIESSMDVLETLAEVQMPLLIHGEVTDPDTDTFDREQKFIDQVLDPLLQRLPELRVVLEHITTSQGADFVAECDADIAATITPQHLLLNRTALFQGGLRPHHYCLPILKRESHRQRLVQAAVSGHPRYFLGTDSAPHLQIAKESACGCAGIYSAHAGIELYAEVFDQENALDKLEQFASLNGPAFYRLPVNQERIELRRKDWLVPGHYSTPEGRLIPFRANQTIAWSLVSDE